MVLKVMVKQVLMFAHCECFVIKLLHAFVSYFAGFKVIRKDALSTIYIKDKTSTDVLIPAEDINEQP